MIRRDPSFERFRKALYCQQPDRVPLAEVLIDEGAKEDFLGKPLNDLATDLEFHIKAGYDYLLLGRRISGFPPLYNAARLHNYYETQRSVVEPGAKKGVIRDWNDFSNYPWMKKADLDLHIFDEAEKVLPKEMKIVRYLGPVFQLTWILMGFECFCYKLAEDPPLVEAVFEKVFNTIFGELEDALQREAVGAIWYVDDIAVKDRLMVSPVFLRKVFFPRLKMIGDCCKKRGIPLIYHTDGDIRTVLQDIIDAGVNGLHPIDPTAMDIYEFKKKLAANMCVIGNVDVDMLECSNPQEVIEDTLKHLKSLGPGGGYALGSSNSIVRTVKPENYRAMLETTLKYGTYPIQIQ